MLKLPSIGGILNPPTANAAQGIASVQNPRWHYNPVTCQYESFGIAGKTAVTADTVPAHIKQAGQAAIDNYIDAYTRANSITYPGMLRNTYAMTGSGARDPLDNESRRRDMIAYRMRWVDGTAMPFDYLETHRAGDKVIVFLVADSKPVVFEDDAGLFPSDTLVAQLRLIQK